MSFQIERGLFKFSDCADFHAVLGVALNADANQIRKRYLKITRSLHPDGSKIKNDQDKKLANQLLSKLVNPAYEQLYKDKSRRNEYQLVLSQMGKRLAAEAPKITLTGEAAKELAKAGANFESVYRSHLDKLAATQYSDLEGVVEKIALLSELNMIYLMRSSGKGMKAANKAPAKAATTQGNGKTPSAKTKPKEAKPEPTSLAAPYIRRAKAYMEKSNFSKAVLELRDALKLEPTNFECHTLMGFAYLKQKQVSMARVHLKKALDLNPDNPEALKGMQAIEKLTGKTTTKTAADAGKASKSSKSSNKSKGNGILSGFFSKKK